MWFPLAPTELDYIGTAPHRFDNEIVIDAPAERIFELISDGRSMGAWFQDFVACRWTTTAPHGVGSTREVELEALTVKERFLTWEPGRRLAFAIYAITVPLVKRMVEDLRLEPVGDRRTRVLWQVHYTPSLVMRAVHPIGRLVFGKMFQASLAGLKRHAEATPG